MRESYSLPEYSSLLARFHQFHTAFDEFIVDRQAMNWAPAWFYADGRMKSGWLAEDLRMLEMSSLPFPVKVREKMTEMLQTPAHLWGAIYVIEGSMLGGVSIRKHFSQSLGLTRNNGLRYFSGYEQQTGANWHAVLQTLDGLQTSMHTATVTAATQTFELLSQSLANH